MNSIMRLKISEMKKLMSLEPDGILSFKMGDIKAVIVLTNDLELLINEIERLDKQ